MLRLPLAKSVILFALVLFVTEKSLAQAPYRLDLVKRQISTRSIGSGFVKDTILVPVPMGGNVNADSTNYFVRLIATAKKNVKTVYFAIFDIQPDGIINELQPNANRLNNYTVDPNSPDTIVVFDLPLQFLPPYGKESIMVLFSDFPIQYSRIENRGSEQLYADDIRWIQQGFMPENLKESGSYYSFNFEIEPDIRIYDFDSDGVPNNLDKCPNAPGVASNSGCPSVAEPKLKATPKRVFSLRKKHKKAYAPPPPYVDKSIGLLLNRYEVPDDKKFVVYPIINFTEPAEPSYTDALSRGSNLKVKTAAHRAFVVKGTINCLKQLEILEIRVRNDSVTRSANYMEQEFEKVADGFRFSLQIELTIGKNIIEVVATTVDGYGVKQLLEMDCAPDENQLTRKDYLVVMAVNDYQNWNKLKNPISDANAIADELTKHYGFDPANVIKLYDQDVTVQKVGETFRELMLKVGENDRVLVYFAGHGYFDPLENEGYWIPINGGKQEETYSFIPNSRINMYICRLKTKHTFFIADACYSGSYMVKDTRGAVNYNQQVDNARSRWMFSSGRMEVVQDEYQNTGHSPFAWFLLDYLQSPPEKTFPCSVLTAAVTKSVANNSPQVPIARPIREAGDEGGEFVFIYR